MKDDRNIYIWDEFEPDYNNGLAFTVAKSEVQAKSNIVAHLGHSVTEWGKVRVYPLADMPDISFAVNGGS
ncbi:MAG: hypothetical protein AAF571_14680 [Verrucomicrobiota bacterium]